MIPIDDVDECDYVICDGTKDCLPNDKKLLVCMDDDGDLYVLCDGGAHYLDCLYYDEHDPKIVLVSILVSKR